MSSDITPIKLIHFAHAIRVVTIENFTPIVAIRGTDFVGLELRVEVLFPPIQVWKVKFLTGID